MIKTNNMPLHTAYQQIRGHGAAIPAIYMQARTCRSYAAGQLTPGTREGISVIDETQQYGVALLHSQRGEISASVGMTASVTYRRC